MKKSKKALVTGAGGFIGSHLVEGLLRDGYKVRALTHYNNSNRLGWLDSFEKKKLASIEIMPADVCDRTAIEHAAQGMDFIFHLAAQASIPQSFKSPESTFDVNAKGTMNILLAARASKCKRVLLASTSEVYGTMHHSPMREDHPLAARSPYAASKIAAEKISQSFFHSYELPVTIVRAFNTYGPRQSQRAIISTVIAQLLLGKKLIHVGSTAPTRDFVFVEDTVRGYIEISKIEKSAGQEINIATGRETSVMEICRLLIKKINPKAKIVQDKQRIRPATSEVNRLVGDNQRLFKLTGWRPSISLEHGLDRTIAWFRKNSADKADHYHI